MTETEKKSSLPSRIGRWVAELILVFVGVYAAFWLNNYQQHEEQLQRRDQILADLQQRLEDGIASVKNEGTKEEKLVSDFQRALDAGQMPPIQPFSFSTDYNPADIATLLQAGGIELLDIKTLTVLREMESDIRGDLSAIEHFQKLSDELIWPNLDQDVSYFYDPATHKLRKKFREYPDALRLVVKFFHDAEKRQSELLQQIEIERQKNH